MIYGTYKDLLGTLATTHPETASVLSTHEEERLKLLRHYSVSDPITPVLGIGYLDGIEQLLTYLKDCQCLFQEPSKLCRVEFLWQRACGDISTALEATLSGMHYIVLNRMRDLSEIEYLFLDFWINPSHIGEWVEADSKTIRDKYTPVKLRRRISKHFETIGEPLGDDIDYSLHSRTLHVNPYDPISELQARGFMTPRGLIAVDFCFAELLEHSRRLVLTIEKLRKRFVDPDANSVGRDFDLTKLRLAWARSRKMLQLFLVAAPPNDQMPKR